MLQARNADRVFRSALSRFVCEEVAADLGTVTGGAPEALKATLGAQATDADFVATYLPHDMEWRDDYKGLLEADALPTGSKLPGYLSERLSWDTFAELTFRSRLGATVGRLGIVAPHVRAEAIDRAVNAFGLRMSEVFGNAADAIEPQEILHFVVGVLDHMRARGAVVTDVTRSTSGTRRGGTPSRRAIRRAGRCRSTPRRRPSRYSLPTAS